MFSSQLELLCTVSEYSDESGGVHFDAALAEVINTFTIRLQD